MSRSGYYEGECAWQWIMWRGRVASAVRGKRGQKLLRDMREALDAMIEKRLSANELETASGEVCALGAVGRLRGLPIDLIDNEDWADLSERFDVAECLAREVMYENDEGSVGYETPEERWQRMSRWIDYHLKKEIG